MLQKATVFLGNWRRLLCILVHTSCTCVMCTHYIGYRPSYPPHAKRLFHTWRQPDQFLAITQIWSSKKEGSAESTNDWIRWPAQGPKPAAIKLGVCWHLLLLSLIVQYCKMIVVLMINCSSSGIVMRKRLTRSTRSVVTKPKRKVTMCITDTRSQIC